VTDLSPGVRLAVFGALLVVVFAGAFAVGRATGTFAPAHSALEVTHR
jgi:hypothetical protein